MPLLKVISKNIVKFSYFKENLITNSPPLWCQPPSKKKKKKKKNSVQRPTPLPLATFVKMLKLKVTTMLKLFVQSQTLATG